MRKYINTPKGKLYYNPKLLYLGIKQINKSIAKENLLLFKKIADANNVQFEIFFGTLLGAIREHDFISHDEDIDIVILEENKNKFLCILYDELKRSGFELVRYDRRGCVYSIMRKGEYIDFYFFRKEQYGIRTCYETEIYPEKYFVDLIPIDFLGDVFYIPRDYEEYLEFCYGPDWRIPIKYANFEMSFLQRYKNKLVWFVLNNIVPLFLYIQIMKIKNKKKGIQKYNDKVLRIKNKYPNAKNIFKY